PTYCTGAGSRWIAYHHADIFGLWTTNSPNNQAPCGRRRCVKFTETWLVVGRCFRSAVGVPNARGYCPACRALSELLSPAGIRNDVIARHPELQPGLIASALRTYTRSVGYLKTLKAGAVRIDLEGNPVGTVTAADEADA